MPSISVDVPTASLPRIKAVAQQFGPHLVPDLVPQGKDPADWTNAEAMAVMQKIVAKFVRDLVKQHEADVAVELARKAAVDKVDADNVVS